MNRDSLLFLAVFAVWLLLALVYAFVPIFAMPGCRQLEVPRRLARLLQQARAFDHVRGHVSLTTDQRDASNMLQLSWRGRARRSAEHETGVSLGEGRGEQLRTRGTLGITHQHDTRRVQSPLACFRHGGERPADALV